MWLSAKGAGSGRNLLPGFLFNVIGFVSFWHEPGFRLVCVCVSQERPSPLRFASNRWFLKQSQTQAVVCLWHYCKSVVVYIWSKRMLNEIVTMWRLYTLQCHGYDFQLTACIFLSHECDIALPGVEKSVAQAPRQADFMSRLVLFFFFSLSSSVGKKENKSYSYLKGFRLII